MIFSFTKISSLFNKEKSIAIKAYFKFQETLFNKKTNSLKILFALLRAKFDSASPQRAELSKETNFKKPYPDPNIKIILFILCLTPLSSLSQTPCQAVFSDMHSFNRAMTQNMLLHPHQKSLFEIYRSSSFEIPMLGMKKDFDDVMEILEKHPELAKVSFREYLIQVKNTAYNNSSDNIQQIIKSLEQSARATNNLFKIKENIGYWKVLLDFPKREEKNSKDKLKKQQNNLEFLEHLNSLISEEDFQFLNNPSSFYREKSLLLYQILNKARNLNIQQDRSIKRISQAMVDVAHIVGFNNEYNKTNLKSKILDMQLKALKNIIQERDSLAKELGFSDFLDLQNHLNRDSPKGLSKKQDILSSLNLAEQEAKMTSHQNHTSEILRVRPLSLQESPFRSCVGGEADCSSRYYFEKALDPNFHYFTLTNKNNKSFGNITIVLGSTKKQEEILNTAFVDKIQNVPEDKILPMLESIRLSLQEQGYRLGLPIQVKGHNALSSTNAISEYISNEVNPHLKNTLESFTPHENNYNFKHTYTRAYHKLDLLEFHLSAVSQQSAEIAPGAIQDPVLAPKDFNFQILLENILSLQNSKKEEDQIQFIANLPNLYEVKSANISAEFIKDYLKNKIKDSNAPFNLRKFALFYWIEFLEKRNKSLNHKDFLKILKEFSKSEEKIILGEMSNWKQSSNVYRKEFISNLTFSFFSKIETIEEFLQSKLRNILDIQSKSETHFHLLTMLLIKNIKIVPELVKLGVDLNVKDNLGKTLLMWAIQHRNIAIVEFLLQNDVDVNMKDNSGRTALMLAFLYKQKKTVELLLQNEVDVHAKDNSGKTAFMLAFREGQIEMAELILKYDATVIKAKDDSGNTAFMLAIIHAGIIREKKIDETKLIKTIQILFEQKEFDINAQNNFGDTAFMLLAKLGYIKSFELILQNDAIDVNAQNSLGETVLMQIIFSKTRGISKSKIIRMAQALLAKKDIDVNLAMNNGDTALILAVKYEIWPIAEILLQLGADMHRENKNGMSALKLVKIKENTDMIQLFKKYKAEKKWIFPSKTKMKEALGLNTN